MTSSIQVLSFDADGTLWDFDTTMRRALLAAIDFLVRRDERLGELTVDRLIEIRQSVARGDGGNPRPMEELRHLAFDEALRRCGNTDQKLVEEVTALYLAERFSDPILFDDVVATLEGLATKFELVLVSNGNSDPERCGLAGVFSTTLFADRLGIAKPDPRIFEQLLIEIGRAPGEVVHIGDSLTDDVDAAQRAGLGTIWLDRFGLPSSEVLLEPQATISSLSELSALMDDWPKVRSRHQSPADS